MLRPSALGDKWSPAFEARKGYVVWFEGDLGGEWEVRSPRYQSPM